MTNFKIIVDFLISFHHSLFLKCFNGQKNSDKFLKCDGVGGGGGEDHTEKILTGKFVTTNLRNS